MDVNLLAVLVAAVVGIVIGYVWYNPKVFGTYWSKLSGRQMGDADTDNMAVTYTLTTLSGLIAAYALAWFFGYADINTASEAIKVVSFGWIGLYMMATLTDYMFGGQGKKLWAFQGIYHLVRFIVMALILVAWK